MNIACDPFQMGKTDEYVFLGEAALAKSRLRARSASLGPVCHSPHIVFAMVYDP